MFTLLSRTNFITRVTLELLSANAFNLDRSEILLSGKEFKFDLDPTPTKKVTEASQGLNLGNNPS